MLLGLTVLQWFLLFLMLGGLALPGHQVAHARHARALMWGLAGFTLLWVILYLLAHNAGMMGKHPLANIDTMALRGYALSVALFSLLEEILALRDESRALRPMVLALTGVFLVLTLIYLIGGALDAF